MGLVEFSCLTFQISFSVVWKTVQPWKQAQKDMVYWHRKTWITESHKFPHLMSENSLENSFFPEYQDFKLNLDHTGFCPSHAAHPKQVLNYRISYSCTTSLSTDGICSDTCAIPLAFDCHRSLSPGAAAVVNRISLLHCRMKVAWQCFWNW